MGHAPASIAPPEVTGQPPSGSSHTDAFEAMFDTTYTSLVGYARRRTTDTATADDVVAETYAIAWRRFAEITNRQHPLPWLYTVAGNVIRNTSRSSVRRLQLADKIEAQPASRGPIDPAAVAASDLRAALARLNDDDAEVLRLVAWEGLSHAEAAEILDCTVNAVALRIRRARQRLETELTATRTTPGDAR